MPVSKNVDETLYGPTIKAADLSALLGRQSPSKARYEKPGLEFINGELVWAGIEHDLPISGAVIAEVFAWIPYLVALQLKRLTWKLLATSGPRLSFCEKTPKPWYMLRGAAAWGGIGIEAQQTQTSHSVYFEDRTLVEPGKSIALDAINGRCLDIRKSHVASVFERVFGYPLALDPTRHVGPMIQKPEVNGVHGGAVVIGPVKPRDGYVYQRLVDTADENNQCSDLRTPCIGGVPALVWRKLKTADGRFSIHNQGAELLGIKDAFSSSEIVKIIKFNAAMGLDCGGLDILRDRNDGRIYIVDVNKTDIGPLIILRWSDKIRSMEIIGAALRNWLVARSNGMTSRTQL